MKSPLYGPLRTNTIEGLAFKSVHVLNKKIEICLTNTSHPKFDLEYIQMRCKFQTELEACGCHICLSYLQDFSSLSEDKDKAWQFIKSRYPWLVARAFGENPTQINLVQDEISSLLGTKFERCSWSYHRPQGRVATDYYNWTTKSYGEPILRGSLLMIDHIDKLIPKKPKSILNEETLVKCLSLVHTFECDPYIQVNSTHDSISV